MHTLQEDEGEVTTSKPFSSRKNARSAPKASPVAKRVGRARLETASPLRASQLPPSATQEEEEEEDEDGPKVWSVRSVRCLGGCGACVSAR